jgi:hypothetical protein
MEVPFNPDFSTIWPIERKRTFTAANRSESISVGIDNLLCNRLNITQKIVNRHLARFRCYSLVPDAFDRNEYLYYFIYYSFDKSSYKKY